MKFCREHAILAVLVLMSAAVAVAGTPLAPPPAPLGPPSAEGGASKSELVTVRGITEPYRNLILKSGGKRQPPWSGKIARICVEEGDQVEAGQILVELDRSEEEIDARIRTFIADSPAELNSAQAKEHILGSMLGASKKLYEATKSISREDIERKELEYQLAAYERQRMQVVKEREKLEATAAADALGKRTLRSPIAGVVAKVFMHEGESCEPVDPLVQVVDVSRGYFLGNVEEKVGRTLTKGQAVPLRIQTGTEQASVNGTISFVSPVADPSSGLMLVKAEFQNPGGVIRPGVAGVMLLQSK